MASPPALTAYVVNLGSNSVTPIDTATNVAGAAIPVGSAPDAIAFTPDGRTAYVVNQGSDSVTPISTATNSAGTAIAVGASPAGIAMAPDGRTVYVTNAGGVVPINTATNTAGSEIAIAGGGFGIAITPDGTTAYVGDLGGNSVTPVDLAHRTLDAAVSVGAAPFNIAITPDGTTVYVAVPRSNGVVPIHTAGNAPGTVIPTGAGADDIAITPDGTTAYVTNETDKTVTPIDIGTSTPGAPIAFPSGAAGIAITPDGTTAYVSNLGNAGSSTVTPMDTSSDTAGPPISVGTESSAIAVAPDQAPVARLGVLAAPLGTASSFDASASTVAFGSIASYAWDFGDGDTSTTTVPTTTHLYAAAGTYSATVTETSSGGTSTGAVFTGKSMSRNGGPSARTSQVVLVVAPGAYTALPPFRICDTRSNLPVNQCTGHSLGPDGTRAVQVTGITGPVGQSVPAKALAVVVNATALGKAGVSSFVSVFPTGEAVPMISNINFVGAAAQANLVIVRIGGGGEISVHNAAGTAGVILDVEGYFAPPGSAPVAGEFHSMPPVRICDTRAGKNTECDGRTTGEPIAGGTWRKVTLSGLPPGAPGGTPSIPATGAAAAVFNLTATQGTQATYLSVAPPDPTTDACPSAARLASNLNPVPGEALPNRVISALGPHQDICVFNAAGSIDIIVDVNGWFGNGNESLPGALFYSVPPTRICDTRAGSNTECSGHELTSGATRLLGIAGIRVVPAEGGSTNPVAVVANLTGVAGNASTVFTLYPSDAPMRPLASDLNPSAGEVIANLAIVALATTGTDAGDATLYNGVGDINAILDVAGWFE